MLPNELIAVFIMRSVDEMLLILKILTSDPKVWPIEDWNIFVRKTSKAYGVKVNTLLHKSLFFPDTGSRIPVLLCRTCCS